MEGATQLVSIMGQLVGEEYRTLRSVGGQVAELRDELATMNAVLRMLSDADDCAVDHFVREWMNQVRELAYDAEDCVHLYIFRVQSRSKDRFFVWSRRLISTLFSRHRLAGEIKDLRARAIVISERHARYGVSREALSRSTSLAPASTARTHVLRPANDPEQFVGISDEAKDLAAKVGKDDVDQKDMVFSIVGFGGLGKTTLAMEVCRELQASFPHQAHVSVSQAFRGVEKELENLLKRVLKQLIDVKLEKENTIVEEVDSLNPDVELDKREKKKPLTPGAVDGMDLPMLSAAIEEKLKDKRYLIVIDDIWTIAAWAVIQSKFPRSNNGSRIIVTTRIDTVAKACSHGSDFIHQMKPLSAENSKKLLLSRVFGSKDASYPKALEAEMDKILKKCAGLPMAIVSIASVLASYQSPESKDMWERICRSIGSEMESNPTLEGMRQIVTLSYNHLPHHLKLCLMYLCIFPEDYVIFKDRLLHRWIAEGLVEEKRGLTLLEVAEGYYKVLMSRNMIDPSPFASNNEDGGVETCRVHDMMLEVMVSKSLEANFVSLVGGQYVGMSYDKIRRLSVHGGEQGAKKMAAGRHGKRDVMDGMNLKHVRSFSMFELEGHKLLDRLDEFSLLRVLDLEDCGALTNEHLGDICRMYLLKFLSMRGTKITKMPQSVGDLEHLEVLDVRSTYLYDLPDAVTSLEKLNRLLIGKKDWLPRWEPPSGISRMKSLLEVNKIKIRDSIKVATEIGDLEGLQGIYVYLDNSSEIHGQVREEFAKSLCRTNDLRWLHVGEISDDPGTLDYLRDLRSPPQLLRYLRFAGGFSRFPDWVGSLSYLVHFCISFAYLEGDEPFDVLCKAPLLRIVELRYKFYNSDRLVARTTHTFPALKEMIVSCWAESPSVFGFEEGSMPMLEKLELNFSDEKKSIEGVEHLKKLKEVQLNGDEDNSSIASALELLKKESDRRTKNNQFLVAVKYD